MGENRRRANHLVTVNARRGPGVVVDDGINHSPRPDDRID
jgi:hypothetical protein